MDVWRRSSKLKPQLLVSEDAAASPQSWRYLPVIGQDAIPFPSLVGSSFLFAFFVATARAPRAANVSGQFSDLDSQIAHFHSAFSFALR